MKSDRKAPVWFLSVNLAVLFLFLLLFTFRYPVRFDNLGGDNIWQSASTIKYVNMWLEEGAASLHFTAYENFASVEFASPEARMPFISYPNGHVTLVYLAARLLGKAEIDISFLKHLQFILFALETMMLADFVWLLFARRSEGAAPVRFVIAVSTAVLWALLPVNAFYLANVFFTDQSVLFYVHLFLLLEIAAPYFTDSGKKPLKILYHVLHALTVFCGVKTDYYFWILVFFVFAVRLAAAAMEGKNRVLVPLLIYPLPVITALVSWLIQMQFTEGWLDLLIFKLRFRTGGDDSTAALISRLTENFTSSFTQEQRSFMLYLFALQAFIAVIGFLVLRSSRKLSLLIKDRDLSLVFAVFISAPFQILLLKNHSAIHEFSMMKAGWCVAMTAPLAAMVWVRAIGADHLTFLKKPFQPLLPVYLLCFFVLVLITGVPTSTSRYIVSRDGEEDYTLAEFIRANTDANDVCFSFTEEISYEPPLQLSVSHKRIYRLKDADGIEARFPDLDARAVKLLLIDREADADSDLRAREEALSEGGAVRAEDGRYLLVEIR